MLDNFVDSCSVGPLMEIQIPSGHCGYGRMPSGIIKTTMLKHNQNVQGLNYLVQFNPFEETIATLLSSFKTF